MLLLVLAVYFTIFWVFIVMDSFILKGLVGALLIFGMMVLVVSYFTMQEGDDDGR